MVGFSRIMGLVCPFIMYLVCGRIFLKKVKKEMPSPSNQLMFGKYFVNTIQFLIVSILFVAITIISFKSEFFAFWNEGLSVSVSHGAYSIAYTDKTNLYWAILLWILGLCLLVSSLTCGYCFTAYRRSKRTASQQESVEKVRTKISTQELLRRMAASFFSVVLIVLLLGMTFTITLKWNVFSPSFSDADVARYDLGFDDLKQAFIQGTSNWGNSEMIEGETSISSWRLFLSYILPLVIYTFIIWSISILVSKVILCIILPVDYSISNTGDGVNASDAVYIAVGLFPVLFIILFSIAKNFMFSALLSELLEVSNLSYQEAIEYIKEYVKVGISLNVRNILVFIFGIGAGIGLPLLDGYLERRYTNDKTGENKS